MSKYTPSGASVLLLAAVIAAPGVAHAQRTTENVVANADDAFGSNVGMEQTGIYSENDTRGFSPVKAGNARIDGVYYDPVGNLSSRIRAGTAIRVGFASEGFPFHAPTGIADYRFRPFPEDLGISLARTFAAYGGSLNEFDLRIPVIKDHIGITGGAATADLRNTDGSYNKSWGIALRPFFRFGGVEVVPFVSTARYTGMYSHPLVVVTGSALPAMPKKRVRYFQPWAKGMQKHWHYGTTLKAAITDDLSLRAGLFRGDAPRNRNYSEIFAVTGQSGSRTETLHRVISDPHQDVNSTSGEALFAWKLGNGKLQHRLFAGYRARNRYTETGGSIRSAAVPVVLGEMDSQTAFLPTPPDDLVNRGRIRQSAWMLGYSGRLEGVGNINLGVQKARYRALLRQAPPANSTLPPVVFAEADSPWLYNASLRIDASQHLSFYLGSERGLEDSGLAPENATNRNDQLPAARTKQHEGGLRWKFDGGQLVVGAFQITKPYFTFNAASDFVRQGNVRHRGVEASLSGHFGKRFNLVAGAVAMQPRVLGAAAARGSRPAGTPSLYAKIDASYRTDVLGGLTPTAALTYTGRRALGPVPLTAPQSGQVMLPGVATVDLGLRQQFHVGKVPASFRAVMQNVFDKASWKVAAPGTIYMDERRRFLLALAADF